MDGPWTRMRVEQALVAAFRLMPDHPVFSAGGRFQVAGEPAYAVEPLSWGLRYLAADPQGRRVLYAWARCRATRASWAALCRDLGWARSSAEVRRIRAAAVIVRRLNDLPAQSGSCLERV